MRTATTLHRDTQTFLIHIFGPGLDDDRYVVERFRSMADGEIRRRSGGVTRAARPSGATTPAARPACARGAACEPCRDARRAGERRQWAARRAGGLWGRCGEATFDGAALEAGRHRRKNAASRKRYARRRARGECTDCGAPSQGAARCEPCARRSYEHSDRFRGLPPFPPSYTVIETATGEDHGTFESLAEVAACLAFARLSPDEVEIVSDVPAVAASW